MTVEELYDRIGGDYAEAVRRLASDALVARFIVRFADDDSCANVVTAWRAGDEEATFGAAHAAKGVCANLALTALADLSGAITEALRPGNDSLRASTDVGALVAELDALHGATVEAIAAFAAE